MSQDRAYESVVILRSSLGEQDIQQFIDSYTVRIQQGGNTLLKTDNWGKRKLAYEVKGERKGTYLCFRFQGFGATIRPIENANRIDDTILKSMTLRLINTPEPEPVTPAETPESTQEPESGIV